MSLENEKQCERAETKAKDECSNTVNIVSNRSRVLGSDAFKIILVLKSGSHLWILPWQVPRRGDTTALASW